MPAAPVLWKDLHRTWHACGPRPMPVLWREPKMAKSTPVDAKRLEVSRRGEFSGTGAIALWCSGSLIAPPRLIRRRVCCSRLFRYRGDQRG